jgi:glycosyltransferase involved in cell wall biosynthesis
MALEGKPAVIRAVFAGASLPSRVAAHLPGFSQAGALFQEGLLGGMAEAGLEVTRVLSVRLVSSFPRFRRIWFSVGSATTAQGVPVTLLPFVNIGPLKTLTLGASAFVSLLRWGWRERRLQGRRVVVLFNVNTPPAAAALVAARMVRARVVAVVADLQVPGSGLLPNTAMRRADFWLQTRSLRSVDGLVAVTRRIALDFAPRVPSLVIEGGVSCRSSRPPEATRVPTQIENRKSFTLMYAGDLSELKGIPLLLEAFTLVADPAVQLWISGCGRLQGAVETAAARDPRITYLGYLDYEELLKRYKRAMVLINPHSTSHESSRYLFPSKLIEYLAAGRPVITTSGEGVEKEYGRFVFLLRDESPEGLSRLIREVQARSPHELDEIGARAQAFVLREKTWALQGKRVADFIRAVAFSGASS